MTTKQSVRGVLGLLIAGLAACTPQSDTSPGPDAGPNGPVCGNNMCETGETPQTCPADCHPTGPICGNAVCEAGESPQACPADCAASMTTQNNSSYTIYHLYIWACGTTSWGPDQLGSHIIAPGQSFTITSIPPGCWDFRAETSGAAQWWQTPSGVNLTAMEHYTWTLIN